MTEMKATKQSFSRRVTAFIVLAVIALSSTSHAFVRPTLALHSNPSGSSSTTSSTELGLMNFLNNGKKKLVKSLAGDYDAAAVKARIVGLIDDNPVLMFSFTTCPFCIKAKEVLDARNAKYTVVELDTDPDGKAIRAEMAEFVGRTSVPAIWIKGAFVGGCNDGPMGGIVSLNESGRLNGLLQEAGAI
jgi:glutaredoxin 3